MTVVIDIETVPTEAALREPYPKGERSHPSNYKDLEKIAAWYERDEAEWKEARVKECSLNPRLGRVLCIGFGLGEAAPIHSQASLETDESHVLKDFWDIVKSRNGRVVTFNGRTFDLRWLVLRSLALGVTPSVPAQIVGGWFAKYRYSGAHTDVRDLLTNWDDRGSGTLDEWCQFLGVPHDTNGATGADVYELYRAGKLTEITAKCCADVESTRQLYRKVAPMFTKEAA